MKPHYILISVLLLSTACGFQLRGSNYAELNISNIYLQPASAPKLTKELRSQLTGAGITLTESVNNANYVIKLSNEIFEKSTLSVDARTGKVEEYQIAYSAIMDARHADGRTISKSDKIRTVRDFTFDENAVLGKFSEEEIVREDLVRFAAGQVLRRLQALLTKANN